MPTFRVTVMLKSGVLDAAGQAVERGLDALAFPAERVRIGKVIELEVPAAHRHRLDEMCERFLANPLIETWRIEELEMAR
jgi:phosphoribosylformylglycinamidine synthase PurS subunit